MDNKLHVLSVAKGLLEDRKHTDPEYSRAIVEMTVRILDLDYDDDHYAIAKLLGVYPITRKM